MQVKTGFLFGFSITLMVAGMFGIGQAQDCQYQHEDVSPATARLYLNLKPDLIVLDVREPSEYCDPDPAGLPPGHIPGALNYPYSSGVLAERYAELPRDAEILVVCRSGGRSHAASSFLDSKCFINIIDMTTGMRNWQWETTTCIDTDKDGINDDLDNCPGKANELQEDIDGDGIGDTCGGLCKQTGQVHPVNMLNFYMLAEQWQGIGTGLAADLNYDERVNLYDLMLLAEIWLSSCEVD